MCLWCASRETGGAHAEAEATQLEQVIDLYTRLDTQGACIAYSRDLHTRAKDRTDSTTRLDHAQLVARSLTRPITQPCSCQSCSSQTPARTAARLRRRPGGREHSTGPYPRSSRTPARPGDGTTFWEPPERRAHHPTTPSLLPRRPDTLREQRNSGGQTLRYVRREDEVAL